MNAPKHLYESCRDPGCMRLPCKAFKDGKAEGYKDGHSDGWMDGGAAGYSAGYAAGSASVGSS